MAILGMANGNGMGMNSYGMRKCGWGFNEQATDMKAS